MVVCDKIDFLRDRGGMRGYECEIPLLTLNSSCTFSFFCVASPFVVHYYDVLLVRMDDNDDDDDNNTTTNNNNN